MSDPNNRRLTLTPAVARRVAKATLRVERSIRNPSSGNPATVRNWNPGIIRAVCTVAIPSGTDTSPSIAGRAQILRWDPASAVSSEDESLDDVRVVNDQTLPADVAVGSVLKLGWCDGDYWLVQADCPPEGE